jgi:hypothetical protein
MSISLRRSELSTSGSTRFNWLQWSNHHSGPWVPAPFEGPRSFTG